ncbi:MAG: glutamine synthetase [Rhodobacterales bacterium]|nr:glutamine synthetase [Rhodobacterales bacterium]
MKLRDKVAAQADACADGSARMKAAGVKYLQGHMADLNGTFRSKMSPFKLSTSGEPLNGILYCVTHGDGQPIGDVAFEAPIAEEKNGYPNIQAVPDVSTLRQHGWSPDVASIISSGYLMNGDPCPLDARLILERVDARLRALGFEASVALEYEFGVFHADHDLMRQGRFSELKPWGQSLRNYDLTRTGDYMEFVKEYMRRMDSIGIGVSGFVSEYGFGMYEFALAPKPALEAADDAVRAKLHLRELCAERGLVATFMTRFQPPGKESACGAHQHISLWKDGAPVMAGEDALLSDTGRRFTAGILNRMRETHLLFRPTINSYRRFDRGAWSPVDVTWGYENRTAALRVITTPTPAAARVEHRVSGADINPYLTVAAILASGCEGIEGAFELQPESIGMESREDRVLLHDNLPDAVADFAASDFCKATFSPEFCHHYLLGRQNEISAFETWKASRITDFEWQRYFL